MFSSVFIMCVTHYYVSLISVKEEYSYPANYSL
jgi:hypothetical protein